MQKSDGVENSLLNELYRKYLKSDPEKDTNQRKLRERMRKRVHRGFRDIALLNQYAREDDIKQIFHRENNGNSAEPNQEVDNRKEMVKVHFVPARHMIQLAWRGLRLNGMDKADIFEKVVIRAIEDAEADYKDVPHGHVESDMELNKLETHHDKDEMDPLEKWERNLSLSANDMSELVNRLPEGAISGEGEDIGELIDKHLVESDE